MIFIFLKPPPFATWTSSQILLIDPRKKQAKRMRSCCPRVFEHDQQVLASSKAFFSPFRIFLGPFPETVYLYINYRLISCYFIFILQQLGMDFSKHTSGTTSVKVRQAPGGKSNFSIGWHVPEATKPTKTVPTNPIVSQPLKDSNQAAGKTSVKVHNPPGGRSNIIFG